jgi:hypothetical protein
MFEQQMDFDATAHENNVAPPCVDNFFEPKQSVALRVLAL